MAALRDCASDGFRRPWIILPLIVAACAAGIVCALRVDTLPPLKDEAEALRLGLRWRAVFDRPLREQPRLLAARLASDGAPLLHAAAVPCISLGGRSRSAAVFVNIPFLALLALAVFGIGSVLYGEGTGAGAATLAVSYPLALGLSRSYLPGTAETALAAAAVYAAIRAERSRMLSWHLALGAAFGLGLWASALFPLFAAPPVAWVLFGPRRTLRYRGSMTRRVWLRSLAAAVAAAAAAPCIPRLAASWRTLIAASSPWGIARYPRTLPETALFLPMTLLLLAGLTSAAAHRRADPALFLWFFVPLFALGLFGASDPRLFAPALPAAALLTAAGVAMIKRPAWRRGLATAAALAAALNAAAFTFPLTPIPLDISFPLSSSEPRLTVVRGTISPRGVDIPRGEDWRLDEILRDLSAQAGPEGTSLGWFLAPHPRFHSAALLYLAEAADLPVAAAAPRDAAFILTRLVAPGQREELWSFAAPWLHLDTIRSYPLPDGSEATLHRALLTRRRHYDAANLPGDTGDARVPDRAAARGRARRACRDSSPPGALVRSPGHPLDPGAYRFTVTMRWEGARPKTPLARIELTAGPNGAVLAAREMAPPEGGDSGGYRAIDLDFTLPRREAPELRVVHTGAADIWIDTVSLAPHVASVPKDASDRSDAASRAR